MSKLPKEALLFAKKMGLDLSGLEPEAEEIWKRLNNMADTNEKEYIEFVAQNLKDGQNSAPENTQEEMKSKTFRPESFFSMTGITTGGDGIKVREENKGVTLYVNFCGHNVVQMPDLRGRRVEDMAAVDGLEIPLLLGEPRYILIKSDNTICIDAVLHSEVAIQCLRSHAFKTQIIHLITEWIKQEKGILCKGLSTPSPSKYMGGLGDAGDIPVLFVVRENYGDLSKNSIDKNDTLSDPVSLLRSRNTAGSDPDIGSFSTIKSSKSKSSADVVTEARPQAGCRMKKGFLSDAKRPLYPTGSGEGTKGGSLANLMDKCTIVNTDKNGKYHVDAACKESPPARSSAWQRDKAEMESLLSAVDDEFKSGQRSTDWNCGGDDDIFKKLAFLAASEPENTAVDIKMSEAKVHSIGSLHVLNDLRNQFVAKITEDKSFMAILISGYKSKQEFSHTDIQASENELIISVGVATENLRIKSQQKYFDKSSIVAKSSTKKGTLLIEAHLDEMSAGEAYIKLANTISRYGLNF